MTIILQGLRSCHVVTQGYRAEVTRHGVCLVKVAPERCLTIADDVRSCDVLARFVQAGVLPAHVSAAVTRPHKRMVINA